MSRPRSESGGPAAAASKRPSVSRRALTLPARPCRIIKDYAAYTNDDLRAAVKEYFRDKAACEHRHGKINTWDVGHVTDMSRPVRQRVLTSSLSYTVRRYFLDTRRETILTVHLVHF